MNIPVGHAGRASQVRCLDWGAGIFLVGGHMKENIMYYPAIVLMIVEAGALAFLIRAWFRAKKEDGRCGR